MPVGNNRHRLYIPLPLPIFQFPYFVSFLPFLVPSHLFPFHLFSSPLPHPYLFLFLTPPFFFSPTPSFPLHTVVLWEGKQLAISVPDRTAHLPSKIDPLLHLHAFLPVYKSIQQAFFDNPKMSLCIQLWNSSVDKQRKFGTKAEFLGQVKFDSMMLTDLLDGRDAWMGVAIPPQGECVRVCMCVCVCVCV